MHLLKAPRMRSGTGNYLSPLTATRSPLAVVVASSRRWQLSYLLPAYSEHFLNCFGQNQVDYLKPLLRLLKIILLALGFVFLLLEVS